MLNSVAIRLEVTGENHKTLKSTQFPRRDVNWTPSERKLLLHQTDRSRRWAGHLDSTGPMKDVYKVSIGLYEVKEEYRPDTKTYLEVIRWE